MATIKAALEGVARALKLQHALRAKAVRRMTARHKEQEKAERQAAAARAEADRLRKEAHHLNTFGPDENQAKAQSLTAKAKRKDEKALTLDAKAAKAKSKAIVFKQRAKRKTQQIEKLEVRSDQLHKKLEAMTPHVGKDGRVAGAKNDGEAFIFANRYIASKCASGDRPNFYSMEGPGFNVKHALLKGGQEHIGQLSGERSDCSLYGTEACWASKLPDPNGTDFTGGFTGTGLGQHNGWKIVSEEAMRKKGWGIVIYLRWEGDTEGHHWENYIGEGGTETIGHGSAPVDPGVIDLFGNGLYACLILED
jgi:hypothetical protein